MGAIIDGLDLDEIKQGPVYRSHFVPEGPFTCDWCSDPATHRLEDRFDPLPQYPHNVACDEHKRLHGWKYQHIRRCVSWIRGR